MADMRYDQYGGPMGYSSREKVQMNYPGRSVPTSRYGMMTMGNAAQNRAMMQQGMGMGGDRGMSMGSPDDMDGPYTYGMMQGNRGAMPMYQRMQKNSDMDMGGMGPQSYRSSQIPSSAYSMSAKSLSEEKRSLYKYYAGVIMGPVKTIESFNYVLPSSCMFPLPSVTQANIHSFSVSLLLYIFYTMPRDALQLYAAQELYQRDFVFHKLNKRWYRKEKTSANYAVYNCGEVFLLENWSFAPCKEVFRISELLSLNDINEFIKKI
ncbi:hypothetical protein WA538_005768, partial [Blastocystis sp. DL]